MSQNLTTPISKKHHLLPSGFDYALYLEYNPDLVENGINNEDLAIRHYLLFGHNEQRVYKHETLLDTPIDIDFDDEFYASEYPDVRSYFKGIENISKKEKLFHHYVHFGKKEGRFKNKQQKQIIKLGTSTISDSIPLASIAHYANKLECIGLLVTSAEIKNGQYTEFVSRLLSHTTHKETKNIYFKIIINNTDNVDIDCTKIKSLFDNIEIIDLHLKPEEDVYIKDNRSVDIMPVYGRKSGPNIMFFRALDFCKNYNTTLFLETDCFFRKLWLRNTLNFINNANSFWISGATYDGIVVNKAGSELSTHINGGVGLYATGNKSFQLFMINCEAFLLEAIKNGLHGLAYDVSIKMYIDHIINYHINKTEDILVSKFINRHYLPNKIIGNFSTTQDNVLSLEEIKHLYNYYIIHKK